MTRVNCVPPEELTDKHLKSEFYELPRVFEEVRRLLAKGIDPRTVEAPAKYTFGPGHFKFFYTRLGYLSTRQSDIAIELAFRKKPIDRSNINGLLIDIPEYLMGDWEPSEEDLELNREQIAKRLAREALKPKRPLTKI